MPLHAAAALITIRRCCCAVRYAFQMLLCRLLTFIVSLHFIFRYFRFFFHALLPFIDACYMSAIAER